MQTKWRPRLFLIIVMGLVWYLPTMLWANPMPFGVPSATPLPQTKLRKHQAISLVKETVHIYDGVKYMMPPLHFKARPYDIGGVRYVGDYTFVNHSKKAVRLRIAFPYYSYELGMLDHGQIDPLKVRFNRKQVKTANVIISLKRKPTKSKRWKAIAKLMRQSLLIPKDSKDDQLSVSLFTVTFPARQKSRLLIRYRMPRQLSNAQGTDYRFSYILQTGRYWQGKIRRCKLIVHMSTKKQPKDYHLSLPGYRIKKRTFVYDFRNIAPKADLFVKVK